jgi:hypothetical protein
VADPVKCKTCGKRPETCSGIVSSWVECPDCWIGPTRKTRRAAILAWNVVMGAVELDWLARRLDKSARAEMKGVKR